MTAKSTWRGHSIVYLKNEQKWVYEDTKEPVSGPSRSCRKCTGEFPLRDDDIDPCLGKLPGVMNACCGHGNPKDAYIQFENGVIVQGFTKSEEED